MYKRDYTDLAGGALVLAIGLFLVIDSTYNYALGTLVSMGPGMFPLGVGYVLAALGVIIMAPAFFRPGATVEISWRPFIAIIAAGLMFSLTIERFGMLPAVAAASAVSTLAERRGRVGPTLVLVASMLVFSVITFRLLLGLNIPLVRWAP